VRSVQIEQRITMVCPDGQSLTVRAKPCDDHRCFRWHAGTRTRCGFKTAEAALQDARNAMASAA